MSLPKFRYIGICSTEANGGHEFVGVFVIREDNSIERLPPRLDLQSHSPCGFSWGYGGSGPAQLALAMLAHHFGSDDVRAVRLHQPFKRCAIASLASDACWYLDSDDIDEVLRKIATRQEEPT